MNDDFSNIFSDFLMEGFGEDPSKVIQRVGLPAPGTAQTYASDEYSSQPPSMESAPVVALGEEAEKPGPTQTPLEAPVVKKYGYGGLAERERLMFLESYAGLSALARNNASSTPSIFWSDSKYNYSYNPGTGATLVGTIASGKLSAATTTVTQNYIKTEGAKKAAARDADAASDTGSSSTASTSSKKKGMSVAGSTALGAGIGAGLGELATRMATLMGPQTAVPLTDAELRGGAAAETPSSGLPWGWILGGVGAIVVIGGIAVVVSKSGKRASSEE